MTKREREKRNENLANDIYNLLRKWDMWIDTTIYYNGKSMSTSHRDEEGKEHFRYNGEPFIYEDDPRKHFEYVAKDHILSMSFEGDLYEILNYEEYPFILKEFDAIFKKYGVYYELGNAWNLTCYEI